MNYDALPQFVLAKLLALEEAVAAVKAGADEIERRIEDRRARLLGIYSLSPYGENAGDPQGRAAIEHRRLIERIIADRPVLRPDEPGPRGPIH